MFDYQQFRQFLHSFAFTNLLRTFRMAITPSKIAIALLALLIACLTGGLMDIMSNSVVTNPSHEIPVKKSMKSIVSSSEIPNELYAYIDGFDESLEEFSSYDSFIAEFKGTKNRQGVFKTLWDYGSEQFNKITMALLQRDFKKVFVHLNKCTQALMWAISHHTFYSLIYFTILIALITIAGGAICRCAALDFSQGAKPGFTEALHFSLSKFKGLLAAPLIPAIFILVASSLIYLLGLIGNIPVIGEILLALGLLPAFVIGLVLSIALIGTIAGSTLMYPAIAYEGSDGFDAISRSFAYIFIKPLSMLLYSIIASIYGAFCHMFVRFFAYMLLIITYYLVSLGISAGCGPEKINAIWSKPELFSLLGSTEPVATNWSESVAGFLVHITVMIPIIMVAAFVLSFYFCGCTIIYALMRRNVDDTPFDDIYTQLREIQASEA